MFVFYQVYLRSYELGFSLNQLINKEDFPTFERPDNAISGRFPEGYCAGPTSTNCKFGFINPSFSNPFLSWQLQRRIVKTEPIKNKMIKENTPSNEFPVI